MKFLASILIVLACLTPGAAGAQSIGPTFAEELAAAGLGGLALTWGADGNIQYGRDVTAQQKSAVAAVLAAHVPTRQRKNVIAFDALIGRFSNAEYADLLQKRASSIAAGTVALVKQWDTALANGKVDLNTSAAANFKAQLVSAGILTQPRADAIFQ